MSRGSGTGSLRFRLLAATLAALSVALVLAGLLLAGLFRDHVLRQFEVSLAEQLDQLTVALSVNAAGQPQVDAQRMTDPRWHRPYSGLYWQIDRLSTDTQSRRGVLRSRSLWDTELNLAADALTDGERHAHLGTGPQDQALLIVERSVRIGDPADAKWRLMVAGDRAQTDQAVTDFNRMLALSLLLLGLLLVLAAWAQVSVGLAPMRALQRALTGLREGHQTRLHGDFPQEVQPLIEDFNTVLDRNAEITERARTQAGNLAHALKTPLAVMAQAARNLSERNTLPALVSEQVAVAQRQLDWQLARARAAATQGLPGQRTALAPVLQGLLRVMGKVHAARELRWQAPAPADDMLFAGESQDLQDMLGNLLDNAARWAAREVAVAAQRQGDRLLITIDDDGPGIAPGQRRDALTRGTRLDESAPGSGLGLHISAELADLYGGALALEDSPLGGLRVRLTLPATHAPANA
jgi:signal transduction histidine kinase